MRDPLERVRDILEAISAIERFSPRDKTVFEEDPLLQVWHLRHLQIIGEAARALPDEVRVLAPTIPWSKIIGMRNVLVHGYFDIDTDIVWEAIYHDIPLLKEDIEQLSVTLETRGMLPK